MTIKCAVWIKRTGRRRSSRPSVFTICGIPSTLFANIPGNTIDQLAQVLGHADTRITKKYYAHLFDQNAQRGGKAHAELRPQPRKERHRDSLAPHICLIPHTCLRVDPDGGQKFFAFGHYTLRFDDACKVAESMGFTHKGGQGSHRAFARDGEPVLLNFQNRNGYIPPYQARQLIEMMDKYGSEEIPD